MHKKLFLSILFGILSSPLLILSADFSNVHELEKLTAIAKEKACNAIAASKSFENFVKYIKAGTVKILYHVGENGFYEKTAINSKNIKELDKKILLLKNMADLECWKFGILQDALSSAKNPSPCGIRSSLKPHEKIIAAPNKLQPLPIKY